MGVWVYAYDHADYLGKLVQGVIELSSIRVWIEQREIYLREIKNPQVEIDEIDEELVNGQVHHFYFPDNFEGRCEYFMR